MYAKYFKNIFTSIQANKIGILKVFLIIVIVLGLINFLGSSLSTRDSKIAQNTELRDMFHQTRSEEHLRSAEKNWMEKFFNINF